MLYKTLNSADSYTIFDITFERKTGLYRVSRCNKVIKFLIMAKCTESESFRVVWGIKFLNWYLYSLSILYISSWGWPGKLVYTSEQCNTKSDYSKKYECYGGIMSDFSYIVSGSTHYRHNPWDLTEYELFNWSQFDLEMAALQVNFLCQRRRVFASKHWRVQPFSGRSISTGKIHEGVDLECRLAKKSDFDDVMKSSEGLHNGYDFLPVVYHK